MKFSLVQAINLALKYALEHDHEVVLLGQDIAMNGGVFRATQDLAEEFGYDRVINTPISEVLMTGMATGMAVAGLKPIVEFQFSGFMLSAIEQLMIHASRMRSRTQSRITCPLVIRAPYGGGIGAPEHHSESPEAFFAHIPGIRVIIPADASKAHGLLLSAIYEPDPVVFLEPKRLYHREQQSIDIGQTIILDQAFIEQIGEDITIVAWGAMLAQVKIAVNNTDASCEVIDLCSIYPIDSCTIIESVNKTGRVIIVQEACKSMGIASEILAIIAENCTPYLLAPPMRLSGYDIPTPYFKNEHQYSPHANQIVSAINQLMEYEHA